MTTTTTAVPVRPSAAALLNMRHVVLDDVDWDFYEHLLEVAGNRQVRITYHKGRVEILAPLAMHESGKKHIGRLIETMTLELGIPMASFGSTTFSNKAVGSGLEPDECYYVQNAARVIGRKRFDPAIHPAPDLAVEVDITSRSIAREPIYAALGVPELWRYDGLRLTVLKLDAFGQYRPSPVSLAFPFLPMDHIESFVHRLEIEPQTKVMRDFPKWVRTTR